MGFALSNLRLESPVFENGASIPPRHAGEGEDLSPPLAWANLPDGASSLVLFCHDPDAPLVGAATYGFVHWVLYNIPASVTELPENVQDYTCGVNDFGRRAYGGPMPPEGHGSHHYFFWLLAVAREPDLDPALSLWSLLRKIEPDVIGMNRLMGVYQRG